MNIKLHNLAYECYNLFDSNISKKIVFGLLTLNVHKKHLFESNKFRHSFAYNLVNYNKL